MPGFKPYLAKKLRGIGKSQNISSDICYHLMLEGRLRRVFDLLDISAKETDEILKVITSPEPKAKKKLFRSKKSPEDNAQFLLRRLVHAHLNYLLLRARLVELKDEIERRATDQKDVLAISQDYPEALDSRALAPEKALTSLDQLLAQVNNQIDVLDKSLADREKLLDEWLGDIQAILQNFLDSNKDDSQIALNDSLSKPQKMQLLRIISGITPESLLVPEPEKGSPDYAMFQQIKKMLTK